MSGFEYTLPVIWALIIGTAVALYVVLDGFDLGVGILFPFFPEEPRRDQMMNSVAPFWDGNETWLVLGGAGLWVAFPKAYAIIMPAVYLPVVLMLLSLVLRGVAFEFRWVAKPSHRTWDNAFAVGSIGAAFCQGLVLGGLLQGIEVRNGEFAGGTFDWLTPFSLMCGVALVAAYGLLGATWINYRCEGALQKRARDTAVWLLGATAVAIAIVSVWTALGIPRIRELWFSTPNIYWLSPVPMATAAVALACWEGLRHERDLKPFLCAIALFLMGYVGLVLSNVPYLVPPVLTVWDAAAAPASQLFMLIGTCLLLPMILGYTVFVYWTFRGKSARGTTEHRGELAEYLHAHIPLSQAMQVAVVIADQIRVVLQAPLAPNINHRDTVFGGSASALAILAAWSVVHSKLSRDGTPARLVIQRNEMEYLAAIDGAFTASADAPDDATWARFARSLARHGKARIEVSAQLDCGTRLAGRFVGQFVALRDNASNGPGSTHV